MSSAPSPVGSALSINVVNKMNKENMKMYLSGLDGNGALIMLAQDGSWYYPSASGPTPQEIPSTVELSLQPNNSTYDIITPGYVRSARLWVAEGGLKFYTVSTPNGPGLVQPAAVNPNDPNAAVNYAFIEFDWEEKSGLYADITQVDFVGLPLGIELLDTSGNKNSALGMAADAAPRLCNMLKEKSSAWGKFGMSLVESQFLLTATQAIYVYTSPTATLSASLRRPISFRKMRMRSRVYLRAT